MKHIKGKFDPNSLYHCILVLHDRHRSQLVDFGEVLIYIYIYIYIYILVNPNITFISLIGY